MASLPSAFQRARPRTAYLSLLAAAALLAACGGGDKKAAQAGGPPAMPPAPVGVITVSQQAVPLQVELPGRVSALRVAQVRARATGVVLQRVFREGSEVKAGQVLYQIDSAPLKALLASSDAQVGRVQANLAQATAQYERYKPLVEANAVSKQEFTTVEAAWKQAQADLAAARAAVDTAKINLDYATVRAPISGRIGQSLVTEGALVSATEATQLATIQQINNVYVNFTQSTSELLQLRKSMANGQTRANTDGAVPVQVLLEDGSEFPRKGRLLFSDLTVDATSGQITLRAEVPNPDGLLLPGQYVRVRLSQATLPSGMLVPQQAVTRGNGRDTVMVVDAENKPQTREVKLGGNQGTNWVVLSGLQPGEKVIVDGFQKMMVPGAPVNPVPWQAAAATPGGAASAPAAGASAAATSAQAPASAASK